MTTLIIPNLAAYVIRRSVGANAKLTSDTFGDALSIWALNFPLLLCGRRFKIGLKLVFVSQRAAGQVPRVEGSVRLDATAIRSPSERIWRRSQTTRSRTGREEIRHSQSVRPTLRAREKLRTTEGRTGKGECERAQSIGQWFSTYRNTPPGLDGKDSGFVVNAGCRTVWTLITH